MVTQTKRLLLALLAVLTAATAWGQKDAELQRKLAGKTRFADIMGIVNRELREEAKDGTRLTTTGEEKEFESEELFWRRWEYYNGLRLDEAGNLTNAAARTWNAFRTDARFAPTNQRTQLSYGAWYELGPYAYSNSASGYNGGQGRVSCIAFHPTDANALYVGTPQGGLWRTANGGSTWMCLTDNMPSTGVSGIVVDRTNANTLYMLTGDGDASPGGFVLGYGFCKPSIGVLKSTDAGANWAPTGELFAGAGAATYYGYKLIQHPTDANTLFAATSAGIHKTTNGGATWTRVQTGSFTDIEFKPGTPATMYAAQYNSAAPFFRSTNSGDNWSTVGVSGVPTGAVRIAIGVSAANASYVYLLTGGATGTGTYRGTYRSTNDGQAFSVTNTAPNLLGYPNNGSDNADQAGYDLCIAVHPTDINQVLTAGINIWKSTNGGSTFSYRTQWFEPTPAGKYVHADVHFMAYNPLNNRLYSCSDGGVAVSTDHGDNWSFISTNLQIMAFYHADAVAANNNLFCGGAQDNGTNYRKNAVSTFTHIYGADGFDCAIDPTNSNVVYYVANGTVLKTTDGGGNSANISPAGIGFFPRLKLDPNNSSIVYAGGSGGVRKSTAGGTGWVNKGAAGGRALAVAPSNSSVVYTSNGSTTSRSDNGGDTWTTISGRPGYPAGLTLSEIAVSAANSSVIWAVFGGYSNGNKVITSTDGGMNWTNISGGLPNIPVFTVVADASNNLYIGTDLGVFFRGSGMTDWRYFNNNLPKTPVTSLLINAASGKIKASTFGRGLFEADLYSPCSADISLYFTQEGTQFFEAGNSITSFATVGGGTGTNVFYQSGNYVDLKPDFKATEGSKFLAYVKPCGTGGIPARIASPTDSVDVQKAELPVGEGSNRPYGVLRRQGPGSFTVLYAKPGKYLLRLSDAGGKAVQVLGEKTMTGAGEETVTVVKPAGKGLHYVQLFYENRLVHFSEW